jgi:O-methyltransferase
MIKKVILGLVEKMGYTVSKKSLTGITNDIKEQEFWDIYSLCKPYTMTSLERMYALYQGMKYILENNIAGDIVECGVYRGGSSMMVAKMLQNRKIINRQVFLYDTFEGMPAPSQNDLDFRGETASELLETDEKNLIRCYADLPDVKANMKLTEFPKSNIHYIKGKVEETIPSTMPKQIAVLRLDTDWYESTYHELVHLYPKLSVNGVLIIDDYGHWEGCRKAVDQYFSEQNISLLLNRIDYTGRIAVKTTN